MLTFRSPALLSLPLLIPPRPGISRILTLLLHQHAHSLLEIILPKLRFLINDHINPIAARREEIVLQGRGPEVRVDDVAWLGVRAGDPFGEFHGVGDRRGEEYVADCVW